VITDHAGLSPVERLLTVFTRVRPGEGRSLQLFFLHGFLLLFSYMIVKALREAFMLTKFSAEVRAYAVAVIALVLMGVVPAYGAVRRRLDGARLLHAVTVFFVVNMAAFAALASTGVSIAFPFFVWVSIFGVMMIAQFWAFAADTYNLKSGQRLFPLIMVGANLGALAGAKCAQLAVGALSPVGLMLVATGVLALTLLLAGPARRAVPEGSLAVVAEHGKPVPRLMGGIGLVLHDRYLLLIAMLVVLLNWINTTGEFILADFVQRDALAVAGSSGGTLDAGELIAAFYGDFQFWVTLVGLAIQLFLVSRIYRHPAIGVRGALLIHPAIVAVGYGLLAISPLIVGFVPIFTLLRLVKIAENSIDYSLMNTTRHALFLPVDRDSKYDGKTAIDTFFWRFGDLVQAGVVYLGLHLLGWAAPQFALLNLLLALVWIGLAVAIGREFGRKAKENVINVAPEVGRPIPDLAYVPGRPFEHKVDGDAFVDADPGDVLHLTARLADGEPLPAWLRFDPRSRRFTGNPPGDVPTEIVVTVIASDVDGLEAESTFVLRCELQRDR
jgi:AAA family ATP:ADP antiporter